MKSGTAETRWPDLILWSLFGLCVCGVFVLGSGIGCSPDGGGMRAHAEADLGVLATAATRFQITHGEYPTHLDQLVPESLNEPLVDPWGRPYQLRAEGGAILLSCTGKSESDPADDITAAIAERGAP